MSEKNDNKTKQTASSVAEFLAELPDAAKRADCEALAALMTEATGEVPAMWGPTMIGFGSYHYRYASGREGDMMRVGFAPRGAKIALYGLRNAPAADELLARLGKHEQAKGCLYVKRLSDVDVATLRELVAGAYAAKPADEVTAD